MKFQQLIQSDALSLLSHLPDDLASLIYIDPPWNNTHTNEPRETEISELYLYTALHSKSILTSKGVLVWHTSPGLVGCVRNILDSIFSTNRFTSEIILKYRLSFPSSRTPRSNHTSLLIYTKTDNFKYVAPTGDVNNGRYTKEDATGRAFILSDITTPFSRPSLSFSWRGSVPPPNRSWRFTLEKLEELYTQGRIEVSAGRQPRLKHYLDEAHAPEIGSVWDDISISPTERQFSVERFPTQQPLMVFERLISAFTDVDDVIIDPFCGSGTTLVAAQMLKRRWLGADISSDAIRIASARLQSIDPALNVLPVESSASFHGHTYRKIADLLKMVSPPPNILLSDIHALVNSAESDVLEFKETLSLCQKEQMKKPYVELAVLKTIGAFLNTKGGTLLVGVSDKNKVLGISAEIDKLYNGSRDKFLLHFQNMLKENIGPKFYPFIGEAIVTVDSTPIFRVDVLPASDPCFVGRGRDEKFYVRRN
ncbi:MAG: DNA methyltransferase, partial [Syntrophus sp. (in: bacteria)]